jgi:hypothetical protein
MAQVKFYGALWDSFRKLSNAFNDLSHAYYQKHWLAGVVGGDHTCGEGTGTTTKVRMSGVCRYVIDGVEYIAENVEGAFPGTADVTATGFGAWRIMLGKTGALTMQRATADGTTVAMNYASAEIALLSLGQIPRTANTVDIGYLVIQAAAGGFTPGTDLPVTSDAQVTSATYYNARLGNTQNGLTAALSVGLSVGTTPEEFAFGTVDARTNGKNVAQIAADTTRVFPYADVITTSGNFGGHLFLTDLVGTGVVVVNQTGIAGVLATVDSASSAVVQTALDAVILALPTLFTVLGQSITKSQKATFTFATDDINGTDGIATFTDAVVTAFTQVTTAGKGIGPGAPAVDYVKFPGGVGAP